MSFYYLTASSSLSIISPFFFSFLLNDIEYSFMLLLVQILELPELIRLISFFSIFNTVLLLDAEIIFFWLFIMLNKFVFIKFKRRLKAWYRSRIF
jgi:hypothetical protein